METNPEILPCWKSAPTPVKSIFLAFFFKRVWYFCSTYWEGVEQGPARITTITLIIVKFMPVDFNYAIKKAGEKINHTTFFILYPRFSLTSVSYRFRPPLSLRRIISTSLLEVTSFHLTKHRGLFLIESSRWTISCLWYRKELVRAQSIFPS